MREKCRAHALIHLAALRSNIARVRELSCGAGVMAVIKADAYGHGLKTISSSIRDQVDAYAVATLKEGIECRQAQSLKPVVVLSEWWCAEQLRDFEAYRLQPVVHHRNHCEWIASYTGSPLSVWLKIDSGMNRLGVSTKEALSIYKKLLKLDGVKAVRAMSHLANADRAHDDFTKNQLKTFRTCSAAMDCEKSLANSGGIINWPETRFQWVRPGLMLYGASPVAGVSPEKLGLSPVMQLQARLISVKSARKGESVGYGSDAITRRDSVIGIVGLGYGDGYPRVVSNEAAVSIGGRRAPLLGRVSMDMITVDLTGLEGVNVGDVVTLWGKELNVDEVARWAGTIPYEILCKVTTRIPRISVSRISVSHEKSRNDG